MYVATVEQQRQEILRLRDAQYELNEIKGQQMLQAYERSNEETKHPEEEQTEKTHVDLRVTELNERLRFANETIAMLTAQSRHEDEEIFNVKSPDSLSERNLSELE